MMRVMRVIGLLVIAALLWPASAVAQNEALRGKMSMSVYVNIYGDREINADFGRLHAFRHAADFLACRGALRRPLGFREGRPVLQRTGGETWRGDEQERAQESVHARPISTRRPARQPPYTMATHVMPGLSSVRSGVSQPALGSAEGCSCTRTMCPHAPQR